MATNTEQIRLQQQMQQQAQMLNMISSIIKSLSDTNAAIIRNIR